jgi:hypothetical protein
VPHKPGAKLSSFLWSVNLKPATKPCKHPTGSAARVATYRSRFERGEQLFHPRDVKSIVPPAGNGPQRPPGEPGVREISLSQLIA